MPVADRAAELRAALVDQLRADGKITSPAVEAAFLAVARERFLPADVTLEVAYGVDNSVVTKRDQHGVSISSVSAAYIQARMLEQAELGPGMTVLEIGSGGLNAALIAEIVGAEGHVVSVDIDPEVIDHAAALLAETGYGSRVRVLAADAEHGVPGEGPFDAIIVTVGAWDVAPAWLDQLADVLATQRTQVWSGVTIKHQTSFADLHLWFAWFLPGFCLLAVDDGTELAAERGSWFPFAVVRGSAFAYLAVRPALAGAGVEFGARAYGRDGEVAATAMVEQIQAWDRDGRHTEPTFGYWPAGSDRAQIPADAAVMDKTYGVVTISWPTRGGAARGSAAAGPRWPQPLLTVRRVMSMAPPTAVLDAPAEAVTEDDFELDMRVVEATTPLVIMMCSTSDGCGSTCSTSACC